MDAGIAILLSADHHLIEFPSTILPEGVTNGSIINITIERNVEQEVRQRDTLLELIDDVYKEFSQVPVAPTIELKRMTQTSITIQWEPLKLFQADLRSIDIYRNNQKLGVVVADGAVTAKCSGLSVNAQYAIHIVVRTSAGVFKSNVLDLRTHSMEDMSGIHVCFGTFIPGTEHEITSLTRTLEKLGATYSEELSTENTHLVCNVGKGPRFEMAGVWNIPVVRGEFLVECARGGRIVAAHGYYLK